MARRKPLKVRLRTLVEEMESRGIRLDEAHDQLERHFLSAALAASDGNQSRAAERLRLHRNTLRRKLQRHGLI